MYHNRINEFWRLLGTSKYCFYLCLLTYFGVYVPEKSTKSFGLLQLMTRKKEKRLWFPRQITSLAFVMQKGLGPIVISGFFLDAYFDAHTFCFSAIVCNCGFFSNQDFPLCSKKSSYLRHLDFVRIKNKSISNDWRRDKQVIAKFGNLVATREQCASERGSSSPLSLFGFSCAKIYCVFSSLKKL